MKNQSCGCGFAILWLAVFSTAVVLFCVAILFAYSINDLAGWSLVKAINIGAGNIITAVVAGMALVLAYREYRIRNAPKFYCRFELSDIGVDPLAINVSVKSTSSEMISVRLSDLSLGDQSITPAQPPISNDVLQPEDQRTFLALSVARDSEEPARFIRFMVTCASTTGPNHRSTLRCGIKIVRSIRNGAFHPFAEWDIYEFKTAFW